MNLYDKCEERYIIISVPDLHAAARHSGGACNDQMLNWHEVLEYFMTGSANRNCAGGV